MYIATIPMKAPYSFERLLRRLESHTDEQLRIDPERKMINRAFRLPNKLALVSIQFTGDMEHPVIQLETKEPLSPVQQEELLRTIRHTFSVDVDLSPLYENMKEQPELSPLVDSFRGLRFLFDADLFESMVSTIIGQQLNLAFAATLKERLIRFAGDTIQDEHGDSYLVFPTAEQVARLEVDQLRPLQFSQRKAEYIIDFARALVNETVELERLHQLSDEEVIAYLTPLRGIGRWTVECLLMFGMGRPDLLPAADIGLRNGIHLVYQLADKPDENAIRRIGESWAPWRSYVSLYLWEAVHAARRGEPFR